MGWSGVSTQIQHSKASWSVDVDAAVAVEEGSVAEEGIFFVVEDEVFAFLLLRPILWSRKRNYTNCNRELFIGWIALQHSLFFEIISERIMMVHRPLTVNQSINRETKRWYLTLQASSEIQLITSVWNWSIKTVNSMDKNGRSWGFVALNEDFDFRMNFQKEKTTDFNSGKPWTSRNVFVFVFSF